MTEVLLVKMLFLHSKKKASNISWDYRMQEALSLIPSMA